MEKSEAYEGWVSGGEKTHALNPYNGATLCGAVGEDGSDPMSRTTPHEDERSFSELSDDACKRCLKVWAKLPD